LARERGRRFLPPAIPGFFRSVDVVEAADACLKAIILAEVLAKFFGSQLATSVSGFRLRGIDFRFLEWRGMCCGLVVLGVAAGRSKACETRHFGIERWFQDIEIQ